MQLQVNRNNDRPAEFRTLCPAGRIRGMVAAKSLGSAA